MTVGSGLSVIVTVTVGSGSSCGSSGMSVIVGSLGSTTWVGSARAACAAFARGEVKGAVARSTAPVNPNEATTADTVVTRARPFTVALRLKPTSAAPKAILDWQK
ncbi:hypothetical protein Ssi03_39490 [Sphaerisporangium siamense]|nr:hypothetical protein Ssi03_39490 [Sphaerisporangium siamense]